ncbi:MAG: NosD domain-containing protein [Candidatus Thorarchaeota archaeon]|jgi:hypothetical protein
MRYAETVGDQLMAMGVGKMFIVVPAAHPLQSEINYNFPDGRVFSTIQSALNACRAGVLDTVAVLCEADHDAGTGYVEDLTMTKDSVRLVGINRPLLNGTGDLITVSGDAVEIAGMFMTPASGKSGVVVDASDHWTIRDNLIKHQAIAAGSYCLELGNTTAANFGRVLNNHMQSGLNGIFFEICNEMLIQGNRINCSDDDSTICIEETLTDGTAIENWIIKNFLWSFAGAGLCITLANDTTSSHFISGNVLIGHATPVTIDKFDEGFASDNVVYADGAVFATQDVTT